MNGNGLRTYAFRIVGVVPFHDTDSLNKAIVVSGIGIGHGITVDQRGVTLYVILGDRVNDLLSVFVLCDVDKFKSPVCCYLLLP
jgi:hypothetical protein